MRSLPDFTSITRSGQRCQKPFFSRVSTRLFKVQDASGERRAPLGSTNPAEEPQTTPRRSVLAQLFSCALICELLTPVREWVGAMTIVSPSAVVSKLGSG